MSYGNHFLRQASSYSSNHNCTSSASQRQHNHSLIAHTGDTELLLVLVPPTTHLTSTYFPAMFRSTAQIQHVSPVPAGTAVSKAVEMLHDHVFFIQCDPYMTKYEALPTPEPAPSIPDTLELKPVAQPKCYSVTDRIHTLPAGLWDSDVVSTYEFIDLERGVFVRTRGPMGLVLETVWEIEETADGGSKIVENVTISCSRLMLGMIKSSCETGWKGVHGKMLERLEGSS